ncbi:MAG: SlyX family protein [Micavibrio aeruginosavorus]|nr:SlyX family protein [Micavibrio aeruginosavorus]
MNDEKLRQIETTLAHQDLQIQDLSEMVTRQWKEIEFLKRQIDQAQEKLSAFEAATPDGTKPLSVSEAAALEKPPHY